MKSLVNATLDKLLGVTRCLEPKNAVLFAELNKKEYPMCEQSQGENKKGDNKTCSFFF